MIATDKNIEELLKRFFNGDTSNEEEELLYSFFNSGEVPDYLKRYISIFEYFESGILEETKELKINERVFEKKSLWNRWKVVVSVAAAILLLILASPLFLNNPNEYNIYEGSYIIQSGEKIYDIEQIKAEKEAIELKIAQKEKELNSLYHSANLKAQEYMDIEKKFNEKN